MLVICVRFGSMCAAVGVRFGLSRTRLVNLVVKFADYME